jgi:hypothetical protein
MRPREEARGARETSSATSDTSCRPVSKPGSSTPVWSIGDVHGDLRHAGRGAARRREPPRHHGAACRHRDRRQIDSLEHRAVHRHEPLVLVEQLAGRGQPTRREAVDPGRYAGQRHPVGGTGGTREDPSVRKTQPRDVEGHDGDVTHHRAGLPGEPPPHGEIARLGRPDRLGRLGLCPTLGESTHLATGAGGADRSTPTTRGHGAATPAQAHFVAAAAALLETRLEWIDRLGARPPRRHHTPRQQHHQHHSQRRHAFQDPRHRGEFRNHGG